MLPEHLRKVRSFVLRQGRMTFKQADALERLWPHYGLSLVDGSLDIEGCFGREAETILEIGFGMGATLAAMAEAEPQKNYLGVEVHKPGVGALLAEVEARGVENLRVYQDDAVAVLHQCIPDNALDGVQIFFPDPWPKRRHHKRRLIQPDFVKLLCQKIRPGGRLHLATDWEDYAQSMMKVLSECALLINSAGLGQYYTGESLRLSTKFERRGERLGHGVYDLVFTRAPKQG